MIRKFIYIAVAVIALTACTSEEDPQDAEPPTLILDVGSEEHYTVGEDVVLIHLTATDPQDMALEFDVADPPERASFNTFQNQAVFNWDPIHSDVTDGPPRELVFTVTNEAGESDERVVQVHIDAGDAGTRFTTSSSQLYDVASQEPLSFDVEVVSDHAPLVILDMPADDAPEGAYLEQTEDFEGTFEWLPTAAQREQTSHQILFTADDETEVVEHRVTVVMHDPSAGSPSGPGQPTEPPGEDCISDDTITHQPLEAQRTAKPFAIEGELVDTSRDWAEILLYWTFEDPILDDPEYLSDVVDIDENSFLGSIPNPLLDAGETATVSYTICAVADESGDDNVVCAPDDYFYQFSVYSPEDEKCRDDGLDFSDPADAAPVSNVEWENYRVCEDAPKYHTYEVADGESAELAISHSAGTTPRVDITYDGEVMDVEEYPCIGLSTVTVDGPGTLEARVIGADLPYHITAFSSGTTCPDEGQYTTPDDALLLSSDFVIFDDKAICSEDDRDVYAIELVRDDHFDAFMYFEHDLGDLDMTLFSPSQVDEVVEDGFGVAQGWSTDDDEYISHIAEESGLHFLSVVTSDQPNEYELMAERRCEVDDEFAGNHSFFDSAPIDMGSDDFQSYDGLKLCENQPDYFYLSHDGSDDVSWAIEITPQYGSASSMDISVLDAVGADVDADIDVTSDRIDVTIDAEPDDAFDLRITSSEPSIYDVVFAEFTF